MNIIVIGAGELGRLLASALSEEDHDVVVVDSDADKLARISDQFDAMTVAGSCSSVRIIVAYIAGSNQSSQSTKQT